MKSRVQKIYKELDRFIKNYRPANQSKYIHLKKDDYRLLVESLFYLSRFHSNTGEMKCAVLILIVIIQKLQ